METVCAKDRCAGCMLCAALCPQGAIRVERGMEAYNGYLQEEACIRCGLCRKKCPQNAPPALRPPQGWYVGWSAEPDIRRRGSSGGVATALARGMLEQGGEVCTCRLSRGEFSFAFFQKPEDLAPAAGSKYVKSDPGGIYRPLGEKLRAGKKVLVIGLPCQIAGVKAYAGDPENLYTVDLICHGSPAPETLARYLKGKGLRLDQLEDLAFRQKDRFGLRLEGRFLDEYEADAYTRAFLQGLIYTENCYHCPYARQERIGDVTLGDAWGSAQEGAGRSLILCQTSKGQDLLRQARLQGKAADPQREAQENRQLNHPSERPPERERFFRDLEKGVSFDRAMLRLDPTQGLKAVARRLLGRKRPNGED